MHLRQECIEQLGHCPKVELYVIWHFQTTVNRYCVCCHPVLTMPVMLIHSSILYIIPESAKINK